MALWFSYFSSVRYIDLSTFFSLKDNKLKPLNTFDSVVMKLGFFGSTKTAKVQLESSAIKLYVSCTEYIEYDLFRQRFGLPDTLVSWAHLLQVSVFNIDTIYTVCVKCFKKCVSTLLFLWQLPRI